MEMPMILFRSMSTQEGSETGIASNQRPSPSSQLSFEAWRAFLRSKSPCQPRVAEPRAFVAHLLPLSICGLAAYALKIQHGCADNDSAADGYVCERTQQSIRLAGTDYYQVLFQVVGRSALTQNERAVQLVAGDLVLRDAARPSSCHANNSEWLALELPRQSLVSHLGFEPTGGLHGRAGMPAAHALFKVVQDSAEGSGSSVGDSFMRLAIYDLIGAVFAPSDPMPFPRHTDMLFKRVSEIMEDRFADPAFGPCDVAAEAGISLRYLQKLFTARNSTCTHFLISVRLDHAARLLQRRTLLSTRQPLCEIAYACGFTDYTNFARRFRHRFGQTPGTYAGDRA